MFVGRGVTEDVGVALMAGIKGVLEDAITVFSVDCVQPEINVRNSKPNQRTIFLCHHLFL